MVLERPPPISRDEKYNCDYSGVFNIKFEQFKPALNDTEFKWYMDLISVFQNQCDASNLKFLLDSESAVGAYRYHGFDPWDDDFYVKCSMRHEDRNAIANVLGNVLGHTLIKADTIWGFFHNENSVSTPRPWKWPFIDIFFFKVNETHYYDATFRDSHESHPVVDILPEGYTVFEALIMPVPRNMKDYISEKYHYTSAPCVTNNWNHKREARARKKRIPCERFFGIYPSVYRNVENGKLQYEELRLGQKSLYRIKQICK